MTNLKQCKHKYKPTLWSPDILDVIFNGVDDVFKDYNPCVPYNVIEKYEKSSSYFSNKIEENRHIASCIEVALAGYDKKDIDVKIVGDEIQIIISKATESENVHYVHRGISKRSGTLKFKLAALYDKKNIRSSFRNGLLTIEIPVQQDQPTVVDIED